MMEVMSSVRKHKVLCDNTLSIIDRCLPALVLGIGMISAPPAVAQAQGPNRVEVVAAIQRDVAPTIQLVGTVRPQRMAIVTAEVSGQVETLPVDDGDLVSTGDVLCKLRDAPRRFAHDEAVARFAGLEAALMVSEAELRKAAFEKDRIERLWKEKRSADKERNDTLADFDAATARRNQARFAVDAQRSVVDRLADDLDRTVIHAPFDGHVVAKRTEIGSWVEEGGAVVDLMDLSVVRVRVDVPESYVAFCRPGAVASATVEALDEDFPGRISRVIPNADERARTFPVDIDIPNKSGKLKGGMFVRAVVPSGPTASRLLIPKDAVVMQGPLPMVYIVRRMEKGQIAEMAQVEVFSEVMDYVAVNVPGLAAGDWVIVRGNEQMRGPGPVIASLRGQPPMLDRPPPDGDGAGSDARAATTNQRKSPSADPEKLLSGTATPPEDRPQPTSQPSAEG